jgi:hypothetical protein
MTHLIRDNVIAAIREALKENGLDSEEWTGDGLVVTAKTVTELNPTPLADLIVRAAFPAADEPASYWHYTKLSALESILTSRTFRLYALTKRLQEGEYRPFCEDHGCAGYLTLDPCTDKPIFEGLCRDLFYGSFVRAGDGREAHMWKVFGDSGKGARLRIRVRPTLSRTDLRPVRYANAESRTLVSAVMAAVSSLGASTFLLRGISRIAAFYLRFDGYESETRLLLKRHIDGVPLGTAGDDKGEYCSIEVNTENDFCRIDLDGVDPGPNATNNQRARVNAAWNAFANETRKGSMNY